MSEAEVFEQFKEKLEETLGQLVLMHNRLFELEKAVGYLLTKDPEWMSAFTKAQAEAGASDESEGNALDLPEG
jgi:hypothetical protein